MSKIGNNPLPITESVTVEFSGKEALIKGPKGEAKLTLPRVIKTEVKENTIYFANSATDKKSRALHGLIRTLMANYIVGVKDLWTKTLEIHGVGYRAKVENGKVVFQLGYSHPVEFEIPSDVTITVTGNKVLVSGVNKQRVGEVAATIKRLRRPDKYKGKGLRYAGEILKLKPGKKAKTAG